MSSSSSSLEETTFAETDWAARPEEIGKLPAACPGTASLGGLCSNEVEMTEEIDWGMTLLLATIDALDCSDGLRGIGIALVLLLGDWYHSEKEGAA